MSEEKVVTHLTDAQAIEFLSTQHLGRLVVRTRDHVDIFPVNYVIDPESGGQGSTIVFRTSEGSKLVSLTIDEDVLFEVDEVQKEQATSVVVRGKASRITSTEESRKVDELNLKPWLPTLKYNYVRIALGEISGRRFALGAEPDHYFNAEY